LSLVSSLVVAASPAIPAQEATEKITACRLSDAPDLEVKVSRMTKANLGWYNQRLKHLVHGEYQDDLEGMMNYKN